MRAAGQRAPCNQALSQKGGRWGVKKNGSADFSAHAERRRFQKGMKKKKKKGGATDAKVNFPSEASAPERLLSSPACDSALDNAVRHICST